MSQAKSTSEVENNIPLAINEFWIRVVEAFGTDNTTAIAQKLQPFVEISQQAVWNWKKPNTKPSADVLLALEATTKFVGRWLLTGEGPKLLSQQAEDLLTPEQIAALKKISGNQWQETLKQIIDEGIELRMRGDQNRAEMPLAFDDYIRAIVRDEIEKNQKGRQPND